MKQLELEPIALRLAVEMAQSGNLHSTGVSSHNLLENLTLLRVIVLCCHYPPTKTARHPSTTPSKITPYLHLPLHRVKGKGEGLSHRCSQADIGKVLEEREAISGFIPDFLQVHVNQKGASRERESTCKTRPGRGC